MKLKITFAAAVTGFLLTLAATAVLGHAALVSSDPPEDGIIVTPYTLTATFDEELTPDGSSIVVEDSTGREVAAGTVSETDDKTMTAEVPALPQGEYEVLWTAVTADDLAIERGTYHFNVAEAALSAPPTSAPSTTAPTTAPSTEAPATTAPSAAPTPAPSAAPGTPTGSSNDLLIALVLAAVIISAVVGFVLYRNRS